MLRGGILFDLNRPQYVSVPEGFISALAWKLRDTPIPNSGVGPRPKPVGLMFKVKKSKTSKIQLIETAPKKVELIEFGVQLEKSGMKNTAGDAGILAQAVINSLAGVQAEKSANQAASPLSPALALLQNMRGVQRTENPPDLAGILGTLYRLGSKEAGTIDEVADRWLHASGRRRDSDPLLAAVDSAVRVSLIDAPLRDRSAHSEMLAMGPFSSDTPFSWFTSVWNKITSDEWVDALPARVWVDWATTVLRLALGHGFLWEAAWYERIARHVLANEIVSMETVLDEVSDVVPWKSSLSTTGVRDVSSQLLWRTHRGAAIRRVLVEWFAGEVRSKYSFEESLKSMSQDASLRIKLTAALGSRDKVATNTWEAVRYALMIRDDAGPFADYYGLLRSNGRYLTVDPGTEWLAVVASLSGAGPNKSSTVATLVKSLRELGLNPELGDLIRLLETAGLARGSADADQGVVIQSAF